MENVCQQRRFGIRFSLARKISGYRSQASVAEISGATPPETESEFAGEWVRTHLGCGRHIGYSIALGGYSGLSSHITHIISLNCNNIGRAVLNGKYIYLTDNVAYE